jgi:methylated-DNA-[protein]-cysteine S-methyltransferase
VIQLTSIDSPVGGLTVAACGGRVCALHLGADEYGVRGALSRWYPGVAVRAGRDPGGAVSVLRRYFEGDLGCLDGVEVEMHGTPFQTRVWDALRSIRAGTTASYGQLARRIGAASAVRAVGAANGANPIAIIVPCHRVIGSDGSLTGYGGGLDRKRWLLRHEGAPATLSLLDAQ